MHSLYYTCLYLLLTFSNAADILKYYETQWNESLAIADNWTRPSYNVEFRNISDNNCRAYGTYDYIIVGGGTAGSVLANRLTENENISVLVIEAGGNETDFSRIPWVRYPTRCSDMNWGYLTSPQTHGCYGTNNNQCGIATAKVLGGETSINSMYYIRGNPQDFKKWSEETVSDSWSYENVLPYFKKAENSMPLDLSYNEYRGKIGPWKISYPEPKSPYTTAVINANEEMGLKNIDYNTDEQIGVARMQTTTYFGQRQSTNRAYLEPVLDRINLHVLTHAFATKILFKRKHATSVSFRYNNICNIGVATKEILITTGAINTPQLLLLSGIGPTNHLNKIGIKLRADLPVGKYLVDYPALNLDINTNVSMNNPTTDVILEDYINGEGLLTYTDGMEIVSFNTNSTSSPDVQVLSYYDIGAFNRLDYGNKLKNFNYSGEVIPVNFGAIQQHVVLLHPKSRGSVSLKTSDPTDFPIINPNYLSHTDDVDTLYLGLLRQQNIVKTNAFKAINATLVPYPTYQECENKSSEIERWYCIIRYKTFSLSLASGTCRMGKSSKTSVVDVNFKLHGFHNVRVIDASVIPVTISSADPSAVVVMIAEKAADLIKATLN